MVNPYGQPDRKKTVFFLVREDLRKSSGDFIRDDLSYFSWLILLVKLRTNFSREERMKRKVNFFSILLHKFQCWQMDYNLQCIVKSIQFEILFHLSTLLKPIQTFFVASKVLECLKFGKSFNCAIRYLESLHFNQNFSTFQISYK